MAAEHWIAEVADELLAEIREVAAAVAAELGPPPDAHDGAQVTTAEYLANAREQSLADPTYMQTDLDAMAPAAITLPDGTMGRSPTGVRNYVEKWREARPDVYAAAMLEAPPPGGA